MAALEEIKRTRKIKPGLPKRPTTSQPASAPQAQSPLGWRPPNLQTLPTRRKITIKTRQEQGPKNVEPVETIIEKPTTAPSWKPPELSLSNVRRRRQPRARAVSPRKDASAELLSQARQLLLSSDAKAAQQKIIEARHSIEKNDQVEHVEEARRLEARIAHMMSAKATLPSDAELFSQNYLKGVQALQAGDYPRALRFFQQRVQQSPRDRAARIRLMECVEVLNRASA
jgi:hypothetical protein